MAEEKTILLTQAAYDKLKEELDHRQGEYRPWPATKWSMCWVPEI